MTKQRSTFDFGFGLLVSASIALAVFFFWVANLYANENRGISWLGQMCHAKSDCKIIERSFQDVGTINVGWLYGTFNSNGCKCSSVVLQDPRPKRVRISICNSTCFPERGRRCQRHECFGGMNTRQANRAILNNDAPLFRRVDRILQMAKADMALAVGTTQFYVQPCLECSVSREARRKLSEYVAAQFAPPVMMVDNPLRDSCFAEYICERHGNVRGRGDTIIDLDGVDYDKIDKQAFWEKNKRALMVLAWKPCANGWKPGPFIPPHQRSKFCKKKDAVEFNDAIIRKGLT